MIIPTMQVIIGKNSIHEIQKILSAESWPEFMNNDKEVKEFWPKLYKEFLFYQAAVLEFNNNVGIVNAIPIHWDVPFDRLPDRGLDWAMEKAADDYAKAMNPNVLVGIQILISNAYKNKRLSLTMLNATKQVAKKNNIAYIALPLRPTMKSYYPEVSMAEYINWKNENNEPYDPWLRFHLRQGGKVVGICNTSMLISGNINDWKLWTKMDFDTSGLYKIEHALSLVDINLENNEGIYLEPNVWIIHEV